MASELQGLVDSLGHRLNRSIAIDNRNLRLLAYNAYAGEVDPLRVQSILHREVPAELVKQLHALGPFDQTDPIVRPPRPEFGLMIERMVLPIVADGQLLGFLWLLASDGPLTASDTDLVRQAVERAAQILQREQQLDDKRQARVGDCLRDLLSEEPAARERAADSMIVEDLLLSAPVAALVAALPHEGNRPLSVQERQSLAVAVERAARRCQPRSVVHLERADHAVLLVAHSGRSMERELDDLAAAVRRNLDATGGWLVGIGTTRDLLGDVHRSYAEAVRAVEVARIVPTLGKIARYSDLGVYGLLAELPLSEVRTRLHPGLRRLRDYDAGSDTLTSTLETFLVHAGDTTRTAADLGIHRATLHYRLRRIAEVAQIELSSGEDRLALHLGLKISRLLGER